MEIISRSGGFDVSCSDDEVTEAFAFISFFGVVLDDWLEQGFNFFTGDGFFVEFVESLSEESTAEIDVVFARVSPDETDF